MSSKSDKDRSGLNLEIVIGIAATIIAISALIVSIWQGAETRRHNRLAFRPALAFGVEENSTDSGIYLYNSGNGPALIKRFAVYVDGQPVQGIGSKMWDNA